MKALLLAATFLMVSALPASHVLAWSGQAGTSDPMDMKAAAIVSQISAGDFAAVAAQFDATLHAQASETDLGNAWHAYVQQNGAFQSAGSPTATAHGDPTIEQIPVQLANTAGQIWIALHPDGTIAGLLFLPGPSGSSGG